MGPPRSLLHGRTACRCHNPVTGAGGRPPAGADNKTTAQQLHEFLAAGEHQLELVAMRVGTWNCRQRLDDKVGWIDELACDVIVVPECARDSGLSQQLGVNALWKGDYDAKGLGVFAFNGWQLSLDDSREDLPWCLPVHAQHPDLDTSFLLLAMWTVKRDGDGRPSYAGQFAKVIDEWHDPLSTGDVIIAGDLNASFQGPSVKAHEQNVARLADMGYRSAYHLATGLAHGEERDMTLRWIGEGKVPYFFHCDYIFVSGQLADQVESAQVGSMAEWVESGSPGRSDHCPVTADLSIS